MLGHPARSRRRGHRVDGAASWSARRPSVGRTTCRLCNRHQKNGSARRFVVWAPFGRRSSMH